MVKTPQKNFSQIAVEAEKLKAEVFQITDNRLRLYARAPALSPSRPLRFADGPLNEDFVG